MNDEAFRSLEGKSKHQLWLELCDLVTKHPNEVKVGVLCCAVLCTLCEGRRKGGRAWLERGVAGGRRQAMQGAVNNLVCTHFPTCASSLSLLNCRR